MPCRDDWPDNSSYNNSEIQQLRKRLDDMTARACRLATLLEPIRTLPREDIPWWEQHKEFDRKRKAAEAAQREAEKSQRKLQYEKLKREFG